jgi:hypothetical protein
MKDASAAKLCSVTWQMIRSLWLVNSEEFSSATLLHADESRAVTKSSTVRTKRDMENVQHFHRFNKLSLNNLRHFCRQYYCTELSSYKLFEEVSRSLTRR